MRGDRRVFTPQAIVDGRGVEPGADRDAILRDLSQIQSTARVPMSISKESDWMHVEIGGGAGGARTEPVGVYLLRVVRSKTVEIGRGENSGRSVTYTNVVRAMNKLGDWNGQPIDFRTLDLRGDDEGYVVLLQAGSTEKPGAILAAAKTGDL